MELTLRFDKAKETKGTWQFTENGPRETQSVGTLYVKKDALKAMGWPQTLKVVICDYNAVPES